MSDLTCFGHAEKCTRTRSCQFAPSCALYSHTEPQINRPLGGQDYDAIAGWAEDVADNINRPDKREADNRGGLSDSADLAGLLNFILHLDDYTLGVLSEIIAPENNSKRLTVAELARIHGISRQGMHRKTLDIVRQRPELAGLLKIVVMKIRKAKRNFRYNTIEKVIDMVQLELDIAK